MHDLEVLHAGHRGTWRSRGLAKERNEACARGGSDRMRHGVARDIFVRGWRRRCRGSSVVLCVLGREGEGSPLCTEQEGGRAHHKRTVELKVRT